ncbi:amidohydrolase family protein [Gaetbulibacter aestuarii]
MAISCQPSKTKTDILITNASVIDVENGTTIPDQLISISNDTIRSVASMAELGQYDAAKTIDAQNKFVMPGLWDNHVHFRGGDRLIGENRNLLKLFLAEGITTVRDCGGDLAPSVMAWKDSIQKGLLEGPNIFTAGPKLDGPRPAWAGSIALHNKNEVSKALDSLESIHVDFVKTYDGSLTPEVYYEIIREAEKRGLKVTGHMPLSADIRKAMDLGLDGVEHMYYFLPVTSPIGDSIRNLNIGYRAIGSLVETHDPNMVKPFMDEAASKGLFVTPTVYIGKVLENLATKDHSSDSLLAIIGSGIIKTYDGRIASAKRRSPEGQTSFEDMERMFNAMVLPAYNSGLPILAGSDCGAFNSYVYPGSSLHSELEMLVKDGLSPAQALKTSFVNGPKFFDQEAYYGSVSSGKVADLLILDENPLDDIRNTRNVNTVIQRSRVYDNKALHDLLERLKTN